MQDLFAEIPSYLPLALAPLLLLLIAPHASGGTRVAFAAVLGLGALGLVVAAILGASDVHRVAVRNPFFDPDRGEPVEYVLDTAAAAGWQWPLVAAFFLLVPAWQLVRLRQRRAGPPRPVRYAVLLTAWWFAARLALEKTAAPEALTWAVGITIPTLLVLPFFGGWCGSRGLGLRRFVLALLDLALLQRVLVAVWSYVATTGRLGTHLDMSSIEKITLPVFGAHDFSGPGDHATAQWFWTVVLPQLTLWIAFTVVAGLVLGAPAFFLAKRRGYEDFSTTIRR